MTHTRRDLPFLLSALAATCANANNPKLPSKTFKFEDLPITKHPTNLERKVFDGATHTGFNVDIHVTELQPGEMPHAPHHHDHEEMILIKDGTMEVTINGNPSTIGPGGVAYVASNEEHGWRNVSKAPAVYFVVAFGR